MSRSRRAKHRGQDLSVAPDPIRCRELIELEDGTTRRCSRFVIHLPGGLRDTRCVSHGRGNYARSLRRKGARQREAAEAARRERRAQVADEIIPRVWRSIRDIQASRERLALAVAKGDISAAQATAIRGVIADAEHTGRVGGWRR